MPFRRIGDTTIAYSVDGLENLAAGAPRMAELALRYVAINTAGQARMNIRAVQAIDTGFMVNTTRARRIGQYLWSIGTAAYYGVFIEYGTVRMAPRPWLGPAMSRAWDLMAQILEASLPDLSRGQQSVPPVSDN